MEPQLTAAYMIHKVILLLIIYVRTLPCKAKELVISTTAMIQEVADNLLSLVNISLLEVQQLLSCINCPTLLVLSDYIVVVLKKKKISHEPIMKL